MTADALWYVVVSRVLQGDRIGKWVDESVIHVGGERGLELARQYVAMRQEDVVGLRLLHTRQFQIRAMIEVEMT
jgi:hypothetical protein